MTEIPQGPVPPQGAAGPLDGLRVIASGTLLGIPVGASFGVS